MLSYVCDPFTEMLLNPVLFWPCTYFLKLLWFARWYACVCVSALRALIISGMIWCDIGRVWLVRQFWRLSPAFNYFIWHLPSIEWMGVAILTQHIVNVYQRKLRWRGTSKRTTKRRSASFIKVSGWMRNGLKQPSTTIKTFHYYGTVV